MATERQIAANRVNGLKGGVKTPEGKAISRMNARKHGAFVMALTEHDSEGLRALLDDLHEDLQPVGSVEELLVDKLAITYLRMQRCARAETTHYLRDWNSAFGQPGKFRYNETLVAIGLYDARLTGQFLRLLHELDWRQARRRNAECGSPAVAPALRSPAASAGGEESAKAGMRTAENGTERSECGVRLARRSFSEGGSAAFDFAQARECGVNGQEEEKMKNEPNSAGVAEPTAAGVPMLDSRRFDHAHGGPEQRRMGRFRGNDGLNAGS